MELEAKHKFEEKQIYATNRIETGIGDIIWGANNLDCKRLMEELEQAIKVYGVKDLIIQIGRI